MSSLSMSDEKKERPVSISLEPVLEDKLRESEVGYELYTQAEGLEWNSEEEGALVRKIDLYILPAFCFIQGLAYLDKTALNYGNLFGMKADLHTTGSQFSWFASAFYLGYLVAAEPVSWLLQRYPTGRVLGILLIIWGVVVMSTAACKSFASGLANRIVLGMLESAVTPGLGLMTPFWWNLREIPIRHLSWYCFNGVAGIIGGFLSYGLGHATHAGVPTWALIFLVLGASTTLYGVYIFLCLPDSPVNAKFLNQRQKEIAIKRVAGNRTGVKNKKFKMYQVKAAFMDPKLYLLFFSSIAAQIPNGVVSNFSSIIIKGMGFNQFQTVLLDIPTSVLQIMSLVGSGYLAGRFKDSRALMMFIGNSTCIVAAAYLTYGKQSNKWGRSLGLILVHVIPICRIRTVVGYGLFECWRIHQATGYDYHDVYCEKNFFDECTFDTYNPPRATVSGQNIAGPHVLLDSESNIGYPTATKSMMAGYAAKTACHLLLAFYMIYENRRRDRLAKESGEDVPEDERRQLAEAAGMRDETEDENKWFRYVL
ncbi:MFS general substrate transporter [Mycena floridula]|nr:MFS general substrate transporter [Mycena floridula]